MTYRFGVKVMPREVILDTQGRAVEQTLQLQHLMAKCRVGKYIELEIEGNEKESLERAQLIAKGVLCNPLIEKFEIEKL